MARQTQWVAGGVYQPTHQPRHAYGPRRSSAYRTYADDPEWASAAVMASDIARYPAAVRHRYQLVAVKMPKGGVRHLLVCPRCSARSAKLYERYHRFFGRWEIACRQCWGLRYRSQYEGRRPEAHPDSLSRAEQRERERPHRDLSMTPCGSPRAVNRWRTHQRRTARYDALRAILDARQWRDVERRELAFALALLVFEARSEAEHRREWRHTLNEVIWHRHEPTMRELVAMPDTPEWARSVLIEALKQPQSDAPSKRGAVQMVKDALNTDPTLHTTRVIEQSRLAELRAEYAALRLGRRATVAA